MKLKRTLAAVVAAVMAFTAVATPLGDNLPAVRDSVSITAKALSVGDIDNKMQQLSQKISERCELAELLWRRLLPGYKPVLRLCTVYL